MMRKTCLAMIAVILFTACSGGGNEPEASAPEPAPTAETAAPADATDTSEKPRGKAKEVAPEPIPQTAWDKVVSGIEADGTVPKEVALQAFDLVIADLPGVEAPEGDDGEIGPAVYGSGPIRWIQPYVDDLTAAQQDAIRAALAPAPGPTSDAAIPDPSAADAAAATSGNDHDIQLIGTSTSGRQHLRSAEQSCTVESYLGATTPDGEAYVTMLQQEQALLEDKLGFTLDVPVYIDTGTIAKGTYAWASAQAPNCATDYATSCHVRIFPANLAGEIDTTWRRVLVHELFHCYQARILPVREAQKRASWMIEGFADFIAQDLHPENQYRDHFKTYLNTPGRPLFSRSYDAMGFFFHLLSFGGDPWGNYVDALMQPTNESQFDTVTGSARASLEQTWASAITMQEFRGDAWFEPEAPDHSVSLVNASITNNTAMTVDALPYSNELRYASFDADIVQFQVSGPANGRIAWEGGNDATLRSIVDVNYCTRPGGCDCPDGTDVSWEAIPASTAVVAVSGIGETTVVEAVGVSLDEVCKPVKLSGNTSQQPAETVDRCAVGVWASQTWGVAGPVSDLDQVGGEGAVMIVERDGTITWDFDNMEPMVNDMELGSTIVHQEHVTRGAAFGTVTASNGKWNTDDLDTNGLQGFTIDEVVGQISMPFGPGVFLVGDGTYECGGESLTLTTQDPVEQQSISITFEKR